MTIQEECINGQKYQFIDVSSKNLGDSMENVLVSSFGYPLNYSLATIVLTALYMIAINIPKSRNPISDTKNVFSLLHLWQVNMSRSTSNNFFKCY